MTDVPDHPVDTPDCPLAIRSLWRAFDRFDSPWHPVVLHTIHTKGHHREDALQAVTGLESATLSTVLEDLADAGFVRRQAEEVGTAPAVRLTETGRSLARVLAELEAGAAAEGSELDETDGASPAPDRDADLVEQATELIGTERMWSGQILHTAAELGMLELVKDEQTPAAAIAAELGLDPDATYRVLRALAHVGVLTEDANERFTLTPIGALFLADHPRSVRPDLLFNRSPEWTRALLHLSDVVAEGGPPGFVCEFGQPFFEYLETEPAFSDIYHDLIAFAAREHPAQILDALEAYDFSSVSRVCDVGGGNGRLLCHLLAANPDLEGTVLDRPAVIAEVDRRWDSRLGVADRCTYVAGDMFEAVPEADAYVLKWILHNFDDDQCTRILSTISAAAPGDGRLFVIEALVPGPETDHVVKRRDVTLFAQLGGRERTRAEYAALLDRAGWRLVETWQPREGPLRILEAATA